MSTYMYMFRALKTTKFCLCPRGNKAWSPRIMDALWFGCIPVLIADYYVPPLLGLINWDSIAITIPEAQVDSLKKLLMSVTNEQVRAMQLSIQEVSFDNQTTPFCNIGCIILWV